MRVISNSENETIELGKKIARQLYKGLIIILTGELGSGKTKFVEGILTYFGMQNEISSPTFTIVNEYNTNKINIYHFDLYRLSDIDEFIDIGGEEYIDKGVCIIEWGESIKDILQNNYVQISFLKDENSWDKRIIEINFFGDTKNMLQV